MALVYVPHTSSRDLLLLPSCLTAISSFILLLHAVLSLEPVQRILVRVGILSEQTLKIPAPAIGKGAILRYRVARWFGCLGLLALSIASSVHNAKSRQDWMRETLMTLPYLYATILASLTISPKNSRHRIIRHVNVVLFGALCVYAYRDVLPLATLARTPEDLEEGRVLWARIALLSITAVVIPVFTPRQYIPVDPLNPMEAPNPEQTASIFSFAFFLFLDRIIFLAYRESQLKEDELYPLCDTDSSAFSGRKARRHIFFGLMRVFRRDFMIGSGLLLVKSLTNYTSPVAMNRLLQYIETGGQDAVVQPWVWIVAIFLAPVIGSLSLQFYIFVITRSLVRFEAIITQLVFAHSLRVRMKAETTTEKETTAESDGSSGPPTVEDLPSFSRDESGSDGDTESAGAGNRTATPAPSEDDTASTVQASSSSFKSGKEPAKPTKEEGKKTEGSMVGKINNLVTTDLGNSRDVLALFVYAPCQVGFGTWFLYALLGWSAWVGLASIILLAPLPGYMAKLVQSYQRERLKHTDGRVQSVTEAINVLRMIKLFGWEGKMKERIGDKRTDEIVWIRKLRIISLCSTVVKYSFILLTWLSTKSTTTLVMGQPLNASKVFATITVFDIVRDCIVQITRWINSLVTGKVSLDRLDDFLKKTELLDEFDEKKEVPVLFPPIASADAQKIGFRNATFSWSKETDGSLTRSRSQYTLRIDGEVLFERGRINLVVGPTGSGKTSLLMALLGEMHWIPSSPDSWYNLPRDGGIAYAAQESWVLNETIRDNITFDTPFDEERYKKVLYQCALEPDLAIFQAGDQTEVGEKGLTLSGGQKARLTLARAVYSKASILLLDDVLAALDVHTAQWIVDKCFGGDLIEDRTIILVTHNIALAAPVAHFVVTFGSDGKMQAKGTLSEVVQRGNLASQIRKEQQILDKTDEEVDSAAEAPVAKPDDGKLIVAEEIEVGHVGASALKMYFLAMSNNRPVFFFTFFLGAVTVDEIFFALKTWFLGQWASQYDDRPAKDVDVPAVAIAFASCCILLVAYIWLAFGQLRASKTIHQTLIDSVLRAPLRWLDITPTSRIIARVTNDIQAVDDSLPNEMGPLAAMIVAMLVRFVAILIYTPIFFFPGAVVGAVGAWIGQIYIAGQLPVKRLMSNTRAPVLANFGAAIAGLVSIRAYGAQSKFSIESLARIDRYTRAARNFYNLTRWVSIRVDMLGSLFSAALAAYLVYIRPTSAGDSGFLINMAVTFTTWLLWILSSLYAFEVQGYINIEHEKPATGAGKPPAYWPASGDLQVENLSARYSEDGPDILHGISFTIKSGERVGIVGRTGSGKSSLTLSLLRCIPTRGSVRFDSLETSELNLEALRSSITIIPQVPELLSGTLRTNLDPFGQYDDEELNSALRSAGLFALQKEMDEGRITLDSAISTGGTNLSVGQRQIFALARAIVRKSKILILDEATSAIDYKTDSIIQTSLRQELHDVSLITVAHRLQTIMDADKIMVLDAGNIVEFGTPKELLKIEGGKLRALVDASGDKEALRAMANAN
ncbi:hypothetical protein B0H11DRAFT_2157316 [Mycena galericulata]|nr:hypothetical protein B0H11DRAFT_2157316 [Mycena galericulata]